MAKYTEGYGKMHISQFKDDDAINFFKLSNDHAQSIDKNRYIVHYLQGKQNEHGSGGFGCHPITSSWTYHIFIDNYGDCINFTRYWTQSYNGCPTISPEDGKAKYTTSLGEYRFSDDLINIIKGYVYGINLGSELTKLKRIAHDYYKQCSAEKDYEIILTQFDEMKLENETIIKQLSNEITIKNDLIKSLRDKIHELKNILESEGSIKLNDYNKIFN